MMNRVLLLIYLTVFLIAESRTAQVDPETGNPFHMAATRNNASFESELLNICDTEFDAVSFIGNDMLIFVGKYLYSMELNKFMRLQDAYNLPENLTKIDGFFMDAKQNAYIFLGQDVYVFPASPLSGYPRIERIYRPTDAPNFQHIAGVFKHERTYFVASDEHFWIFSNPYDWFPDQLPAKQLNGTDTFHYVLSNLLPLTAAFTDREGMAYFVKGKRYNILSETSWGFSSKNEESTRHLICSQQVHYFTNKPSCCLDPPRHIVKVFGPRALFVRYGMRRSVVFDICKTRFDTIALARKSLFMFIGKYMYSAAQNEFMLIRDAYPGLPKDLTKIDAYVLLPDGKEYFFIGNKLYIISSWHLMSIITRDLTEFGFQPHIEHVDAAFYYNGTVIVIIGDQIWDFSNITETQNINNFNGPLLTVTNELEAIQYIVHDGQYSMMGVGVGNHTQHDTIKQKDLVCNPRVLEDQLPPTCCNLLTINYCNV